MARKKKVEEQSEPQEENFFLTEDEFESQWGNQSQKESNQTLPTPIFRQAKVALILKHKNEIVLEILSNHTGERIQYNPEIHSQLREGDLIDVP
jgi:hypothetical protein